MIKKTIPGKTRIQILRFLKYFRKIALGILELIEMYNPGYDWDVRILGYVNK